MNETNGIGSLISWLQQHGEDAGSESTGNRAVQPRVDVGARLYSAIAVTVRSYSDYEEYLRRLGEVIEQGRYATRGERILQLEPRGLAQRLNVVYYENARVRDELRADRTFQNILLIRDRSVRMSGIDGYAIAGDFSPTDDAAQRAYCVEFLHFHDAHSPGRFVDYLRGASEVLLRYGYHIERSIRPTAAFGGAAMPHLVNVTYFETEEHQKAFACDHRHEALQRQRSECIAQHTTYSGRLANPAREHRK